MPVNHFSLFASNDSTPQLFSLDKVHLPWPSIPVLLPRRLRRKLRSKIRSRQTPTSSIANLDTSLNPADTLRALRAHQWTYHDAQYPILALLGIFSFCMISVPGPWTKTLVAGLLMTSLAIPLTRQFFLPFLPIATWLILFYACQFVPHEWRPQVWVRVLPALENILYGANLSNILSAHKNTLLDVLAWLPYGITHFGAPFVCSGLMFVFGPPGTLPVFARSFGYMNIIGVLIQLFVPCSAPWYENLHGLAPANYSMQGSPAGLAAIDKLFGIDLYTSTFTASPMVFGAFPSLHSGCATIEALFMAHTFPRLRPLFVAYVLWLWWSTMYLSHHYVIDLVAGSLISVVVYFIAKSKFLPRLQPGKLLRWDYDYVEYGEASEITMSSFDALDGCVRAPRDSEEWTVASGSSASGGSRAPSTGLRSPVGDEDMWEGETLASSDDERSYKF